MAVAQEQLEKSNKAAFLANSMKITFGQIMPLLQVKPPRVRLYSLHCFSSYCYLNREKNQLFHCIASKHHSTHTVTAGIKKGYYYT